MCVFLRMLLTEACHKQTDKDNCYNHPMRSSICSMMECSLGAEKPCIYLFVCLLSQKHINKGPEKTGIRSDNTVKLNDYVCYNDLQFVIAETGNDCKTRMNLSD